MLYILQDWKVNRYSSKARLILVLFRVTSLLNSRNSTKIIFYPLIILHKVIVEWIFGIEININARVGKNFQFFHGQGLVINGTAEIGCNCLVRNGVTIGNKVLSSGVITRAAIIGNNVDIGCNVCIIGDIDIGDNVTIGAGSVVVKTIPPNCVIAGNPSKIIRYKT